MKKVTLESEDFLNGTLHSFLAYWPVQLCSERAARCLCTLAKVNNLQLFDCMFLFTAMIPWKTYLDLRCLGCHGARKNILVLQLGGAKRFGRDGGLGGLRSGARGIMVLLCLEGEVERAQLLPLPVERKSCRKVQVRAKVHVTHPVGTIERGDTDTT